MPMGLGYDDGTKTQTSKRKKAGGVNTILDGIITGIFGSSTDLMSEKDRKAAESERAQKQNDAFALADSARNNPGEAFMNGPNLSSDGGDLFQTIGKIVKFFGG